MKKLLTSFLMALSVTGTVANAADDIDPRNVQTAQAVCETCHGIGGASKNSLFPRIAGQHPHYIDKELKEFRDRTRADPFAQAYMWGIAAPLSDAEIADLATYFSQQPPAPGLDSSAEPEVIARGKELYDNGDEAKKIPACSSCHGANGEGSDDFPRLAGQHAEYLVRQIIAFRTSTRRNDIMHANAEDISDSDADAVAEYLTQK